MNHCIRVRCRCLLFLAILLVAVLTGGPFTVLAETFDLAQTSTWNQKFGEIRDLYYRGQPDRAIQMLEDQIETLGNTYSDATLTEILAVVKDYFTISKDYGRFQALTYNMLAANRVDRIVNSYKGTSLYEYARKARSDWMRPAAASIRVDEEEIDINESTKFYLSVTNQKKVRLARPDVSVKVSPEDYAKLDGNTVVGLQSGTVTLQVVDSDGNVLAERAITIREGLGVTVSPEYKELPIKESETFTIQSNKPLSKFGIKWTLDPPGLATGKLLSEDSEAGKKLVNVTAAEPGTSLLKVTDEAGKDLAQATIYTPPVPPSKLWPLVTSGAVVVFGVYAIIQSMAANDKFDEHEQCRNTVPAGGDQTPCDELYDEYKSKYNQATVGWVLAGVSAVGTGYLWWKYIKAKKAYDEKLNESSPISLYISPTQTLVTLGFNF
jgi:hypothetical protein